MSGTVKNVVLVLSVAVIAYMLWADHQEAKQLQNPTAPLGNNLGSNFWGPPDPNAFVPMGGINGYPGQSPWVVN